MRDEPHPKDFDAEAELPNGIKIEYTGLRPGEKLYKELLLEDAEKETKYESITIAVVTKVNWKGFESNAGKLTYRLCIRWECQRYNSNIKEIRSRRQPSEWCLQDCIGERGSKKQEARGNINSHLSLGRPGAVIDCQQEKGMERKS